VELLCDYEEEQLRKGHFKRIFPLKENIDTYAKFFEAPRRANIVLWAFMRAGCPKNLLV
jgi:hypothetical protein